MALNTKYTGMKDWVRTTYIGLKELPEGEKLDDWVANGEWAKVEPGDDDPENREFDVVAKEEGWVIYRLDPTLEAIIFAGMVMQPKGAGITQANFEEWAERLLIWQEAQGPIGTRFYPEKTQHPRFENAQTYWRDFYLTKEDLKKYIGLWTNCSSVTKSEFRKKLEAALKAKARRREHESAQRAEEFKLLEKVAKANKAADEEEDREVSCWACEWKGRESQTDPIQDLAERIDAGEEVPAGQCPECGALVHLVVKA